MSNISQQLDISNKSYTNKDFASIYTELLSYAEKISYRFSPVSANETDPFVVMLKLAAFVADKINYNVDKNILERFIATCTQETSMQQLTEMLGYHMHFYLSASTDVIFRYSGSLTDAKTISKFTTITTADNIQYITLADAIIDPNTNQSLPVTAIQGKLKDLNILDSTVVQLENLDANNRIYFPEYHVAENGVFISNISNTDTSSSIEWELSENLNEEDYLSYVYKFGYDSSKKLPYIEFPTWINDIIRDGLSIKYLVSSGYAGNVSPKSFSSVNFIPEGLDAEALSVINMSASINGKDPETINESYKGFKRLVGTFDTLVTCRDYAAKIYELLDENDNFVSNVIVSDRRTDINNSISISTITDIGNQLVSEVKMTESEKAATEGTKTKEGGGTEKITTLKTAIISEPSMTPHDLCLYPFNPIKSTSYLSKDKAYGYNDSFKLISDIKLEQLKAQIEEEKAISHTYKDLSANDIIAIPIYLKLTAIVNTTEKISGIASEEILLNIKSALIRDYNPRAIEFGKEIAHENLVATMESADSRIKSVILYPVEQTPKFTTIDNGNYKEDGWLDTNKLSTAFKFILMKNIVSGKVSAFNYDESFNYRYDYQSCERLSGCTTLTSEANIKIPKSNDYSYTLQQNEAIQFIAPKFDAFVTYPYGVLYNLKLSGNTYIPKGAEYQLRDDESLSLAYANSDGEYQIVEYSSAGEKIDGEYTENKNVIICPNFDMPTTDNRQSQNETVDKTFINSNGTSMHYYQLAAKEEVVCKKALKEVLTKNSYKVYWLMNNSDNKINWVDDNTYTLAEGEYFYFSDMSNTSLNEFGSGTTLTISSELAKINNFWSIDNPVSITDVAEYGLEYLKNEFKIITFTESQSLSITLNQIKTLAEGATIRITNPTSNPDPISVKNNTFVAVDNCDKIEYKYGDISSTFEVLSDRSTLDPGDQWKWRGLLDISCGPNKAQQLTGNQQIILRYLDSDGGSHTHTIEETPATDDAVAIPACIKSNVDIQLGGGVNLDLGYKTISDLMSDTSDSITYPDFLHFSINSNISNELNEQFNGMYSIDISSKANSVAFYLPQIENAIGFTVVLPADTANTAVTLQIYYSKKDLTSEDLDYLYVINKNSKFSEDTSTLKLALYDTNSSSAISSVPLAAGVNSIIISSNNVTSVAFKNNTRTDINVKFSDIRVLDKEHPLNPALGIDIVYEGDTAVTDMLDDLIKSNISSFPKIKECAFLEPINYVRAIEVTEDFPLTSAEAFYDVNNAANSWVIPKFDFANSAIKISNNSLRR